MSDKANSWDGFFALRDSGVDEARDFLLERSDPPPQTRALLEPKRSRRKK